MRKYKFQFNYYPYNLIFVVKRIVLTIFKITSLLA
jgi:hypothetical protein